MELGQRYVVHRAPRDADADADADAPDGDVVMSLQYKFKPTSVDMTKPAQVTVVSNEVNVTLQNQDGNDEKFHGAAARPSNEFILGFVPESGSFTLSRITVSALNLRPVTQGNTTSMTSGEDVERTQRTRKRLDELMKPTKKKRR